MPSQHQQTATRAFLRSSDLILVTKSNKRKDPAGQTQTVTDLSVLLGDERNDQTVHSSQFSSFQQFDILQHCHSKVTPGMFSPGTEAYCVSAGGEFVF